ncbi:MAG TPA: HlyD family secretion protein [Cyclobacteriaceae bacterium]|nr:HlyD family secretion protein [Cyclobacteriaceae bacterium]
MNKKVIYAVLAVVVVVGGFFGWRYYQFLSTHIETDDAQVEGNIVPVLSRVGSFIEKIHVVDNQVVKKGELLVELDSADLSLKLEQAISAHKGAISNIAVARSMTEDARLAQQLAVTSIETPKTNLWKARNEYARYKDLFEQKLATPQKLDEVKADLENAEAQFALANQKAESAKVQYQTAANQLKVAESNADMRLKEINVAKLQLSYTKIYAPIAGVVSKKTVQAGQLIQAGQPLMSLVQSDEIWVTANYKETQLEGMNVGNDVLVKVDAFPHINFKGKVESLGGATGAKFSLIPPDNASGNFVKVVQRVSVRIALESTPDVKNLLKPGLSVQATVTKSL